MDYADAQLFNGATTYPGILVARKTAAGTTEHLRYARATDETSLLPIRILETGFAPSAQMLTKEAWAFVSKRAQQILDKIEQQSSPLGSVYGEAQIGVKTSLNKAFVVDPKTAAKLVADDSSANEILKPYGRGRDLAKWISVTNGDFLVCSREIVEIQRYPSILRYLKQHEAELRARYEVRRGDYEWWVVRQVARTDIYENDKIVYPDLCIEARFSLNADGMYPNNTVFCLPSRSLSLLGYLNSKLAWFWITNHCPANRGGAYRLSNQHMNRIPVHSGLQDSKKLREVVSSTLDLAAPAARVSYEKEMRERQLGNAERQIDQLVYKLYGLTDKEIRIVEEATK